MDDLFGVVRKFHDTGCHTRRSALCRYVEFKAMPSKKVIEAQLRTEILLKGHVQSFLWKFKTAFPRGREYSLTDIEREKMKSGRERLQPLLNSRR